MINFIRKNTSSVKTIEEIEGYIAINDYASALSVANEYILNNSFNTDIWKTKAKILSACGKHHEAIKVYREIIKQNSYDFSVLYNVSKEYLQVNHYINALEILENIVFSNISNHEKLFVLKDLLKLYVLSGDYKKVIELYLSNRILMTEDLHTLFYVAQAYKYLGEIEDSKELFCTILLKLKDDKNPKTEIKSLLKNVYSELMNLYFGKEGLREKLLYQYNSVYTGCYLDNGFDIPLYKEITLDKKTVSSILTRFLSIVKKTTPRLSYVSYSGLHNKFIAFVISQATGLPLINFDDRTCHETLGIVVIDSSSSHLACLDNALTFSLTYPYSDSLKETPDFVGILLDGSLGNISIPLEYTGDTFLESETYDILVQMYAGTGVEKQEALYLSHRDLLRCSKVILNNSVQDVTNHWGNYRGNIGDDIRSNDILVTSKVINYLYFNKKLVDSDVLIRLEELFHEQKLFRCLIHTILKDNDPHRYFKFLIDNILETRESDLLPYLSCYHDASAIDQYLKILQLEDDKILLSALQSKFMVDAVKYTDSFDSFVQVIIQKASPEVINSFLEWLCSNPDLAHKYISFFDSFLETQNNRLGSLLSKLYTVSKQHLPINFVYKALYSKDDSFILHTINNLIVVHDRVDKSIIATLLNHSCEDIVRQTALLALMSEQETLVLEYISRASSQEQILKLAGIFKLTGKNNLVSNLVNMLNAHPKRDEFISVFMDDLLALSGKNLKHFFLAHESIILKKQPPSLLDYADEVQDLDLKHMLGSYLLSTPYIRYSAALVLNKIGYEKFNSIAKDAVNSLNKSIVQELLKAVMCYNTPYFFGLLQAFGTKKDFVSIFGDICLNTLSDKKLFNRFLSCLKGNVDFKLRCIDLLKSYYSITQEVALKVTILNLLHQIDKREAYSYSEICLMSNDLDCSVLSSMIFLSENYPTKLSEKTRHSSYQRTIQVQNILSGIRKNSC